MTLRMSVGVHSGLFDFFLVGASHRELIVTGPAASTTVSMEAAAEAGEILVSEPPRRRWPQISGRPRTGTSSTPPGGRAPLPRLPATRRDRVGPVSVHPRRAPGRSRAPAKSQSTAV